MTSSEINLRLWVARRKSDGFYWRSYKKRKSFFAPFWIEGIKNATLFTQKGFLVNSMRQMKNEDEFEYIELLVIDPTRSQWVMVTREK